MSELKMQRDSEMPLLDDLDYRIIHATQKGLPRVSQPYHSVAAELGVQAEEVMQRITRMQDIGVIRRGSENAHLLGAHGLSGGLDDKPVPLTPGALGTLYQ